MVPGEQGLAARRPHRLLGAALAAALLLGACTGDDGDDDDAGPGPGDREAPEYRATITRTEHGVPHVRADDLASVGFGYGYAFAEDHLCTLADAIVAVRSERARHHGPGPDDRHVASDAVYRALDLQDAARALIDGLDPDLRDVIAGYAAGYNAQLADVGAEGVTGWCAGEPWVRPIDEYDLGAYYRSLTGYASLQPLLGYTFAASPPEPAGSGEPADGDLEGALAALLPDPAEIGSNGWAIGPDRSESGETMLVGNPHFPWQGALRFYEVHLTVPGTLDVYGASLLGSPAVNIGFNEHVAWTHTVSAGSRFTAYTLDLVDGDPTRYRYGDEERDLRPVEVTVEVLDGDEVVEQEHTIWFSHHGPVIDFPGVGWTPQRVLTFRDANADNDEVIPQFFAMNTAGSMDELISAHRDIGGIPWVNTIAASAEGRIWYADTSAAPNLSPEAVEAWRERVASDPITSIALDNGVILLDGSDPLFDWVDAPGARDPGLVPFDDMPQLERTDVLFNANDPYWLTNPDELLVLDSPVFGRAERPVTPRTRMNAVQLGVEDGDSGPDGRFSFEELRDSALSNRVFTAEALVDEVVDRCRGVEELGPACEVLDTWDRKVDLDSVGAVLWRELITSYDTAALRDAGELWAEPFDPTDPVGTPRGLAPAPEDGPDPLLERLEAAVDALERAGVAVDAPLGEVQAADRAGERVPIHGGRGDEGVTNVVGFGGNDTTNEPAVERGEPVEGSRLTTLGYPISNGTSFIYVLEFADGGPRAVSLLTYGGSGDPGSPEHVAQTRRFSAKDWKEVRFRAEDIEADPAARTYEVGAAR
jgi:acyl-homoserine-lactone acylase